jgi:hypothetical protein
MWYRQRLLFSAAFAVTSDMLTFLICQTFVVTICSYIFHTISFF